MPHDKHGNPVEVGDLVTVTAKVKQVNISEEYCNVTLELPPMPPYTDPYSLVLNAKQCEVILKGYGKE